MPVIVFLLIRLHLLTFMTDLLINASSQTELFSIPKKEIYVLDETLTIACRTKYLSTLMIKYQQLGPQSTLSQIIAFKCNSMWRVSIKVTCGHVGEYYYLNVTVPKIANEYSGRYICTDNTNTAEWDLNIAVFPQLSIQLTNTTDNKTDVYKNSEQKPDVIYGMGTYEQPYDLRYLQTKPAILLCSSSCSNPRVSFDWGFIPMNGDEKDREVLITKESQPKNDVPCNEQLYKSTSSMIIDCAKFKLSGMNMFMCNASNESLKVPISKQVYFLCQGRDVNNQTGAMLKINASKVTTGEMINIAIGCSIGLFLLVAGIVLICRKKSKNDEIRYTMRQDNLDHPGYRV